MRNSSFPETCVLKEIFIGNTVKDKFTVIQPFQIVDFIRILRGY
jgi:hypothetical protein